MNHSSSSHGTTLKPCKLCRSPRLVLAMIVASAAFSPVFPSFAGDTSHAQDRTVVVAKTSSQPLALHSDVRAIVVPARMHGTGAMVDAEGRLHVHCVDPSEASFASGAQMREQASRSIIREK